MVRRFLRKRSTLTILDEYPQIHDGGVLAETFGIGIYDGTVEPFAARGDAYPSKGSFLFSTTDDDQDQIPLLFFIGVEQEAANCRFLGAVRLRGFELGPAGEPVVRLHFSINENKIRLWATDENGSNEILTILVKTAGAETVH